MRTSKTCTGSFEFTSTKNMEQISTPDASTSLRLLAAATAIRQLYLKTFDDDNWLNDSRDEDCSE